MNLRASLLAACCLLAVQAHAGILSDDEARKGVQALNERVQKLEDAQKEQTKSLLDLQSQIEALNIELRKLRGQNEELVHNLQDAEKRQKDFYVDLDGRLRHFEVDSEQAAASSEATDSPVQENRAFETAFGLHRAKSYQSAITAFQEFQRKYPNSVQLPNVYFLMGDSFINLKDYPSAVMTFQTFLDAAPKHPKAPEALLHMATAQQELKQPLLVKKTLKKLVTQYPDSEAAAKAKERLAVLK